MRLPALAIRQPWAWLILHRGKDIENRWWPTRFRGTVLIHAAKGMTLDEYDDAAEFAANVLSHSGGGVAVEPSPEAIERGGIVGAARIVDCRLNRADECKSRWEIPGQMGFVLESPVPLPLRAYRGLQGFFSVELTPEEERVLREAGLLP